MRFLYPPLPLFLSFLGLGSALSSQYYSSIFSFGDSFTDTGNVAFFSQLYSLADPMINPPYGMTFFGHPTGRCSDGRLILDFIAETLELPFVPPFWAHNGSFRQGANFAVAGSTTLDVAFFRKNNISSGSLPLNTTLSVQLDWFESLKPSLCSTTEECKDFLGKSLFFVGEFGVNDYHFLFQFGRKSVPEVGSSVPDIIGTILMAVERLIKQGAMTLVVPGVTPIGCSPMILSLFASPDLTDYDARTGCLKEFNGLAVYHNSLLRKALEKLQSEYPGVRVIYADFFQPIIELVESPKQFGFIEEVLRVCCGNGGGMYNFNVSATCGMPDATTCHNPPTYVNWDGIHLTDATYHYIANSWLKKLNLFAGVVDDA